MKDIEIDGCAFVADEQFLRDLLVAVNGLQSRSLQAVSAAITAMPRNGSDDLDCATARDAEVELYRLQLLEQVT